MLGIETSLFKDFSLFGRTRSDDPRAKEEGRLEPRLGTPGEQTQAPPSASTSDAPAVEIQLSKKALAIKEAESGILMLPAPSERANVRSMTPRELADFAYNMYMDGTLSWDEYRMVGFPSELHPDFDKTIGQLTGEHAQPDRPKDMVTAWQQRVEFEERYSANNPEAIERARRVLDVLRWQDAPPEPVKIVA
ncbi:conserved hypothetical protein [Rhodospirillaceae bacterium LM-1]|nr:conserved hypothetical protein [Rhodospirillaceae bacterium LM-1]